MAKEFFTIHPVIPEEKRAQVSSWEQRRPVDIEPRDFHVETVEANQKYQLIIPEIVSLVEKGQLGDFSVLFPSWKEIPQIGVSRKLLVTHPSCPQDIFIIGGIGGVTPQEERLHIAPPDPGHTVHTRHNISGPFMATGYIREDGKTEVVRSQEPYGGYWLRSSIYKYRKTMEAQSILPSPEHVCSPVFAGQLEGIPSEQPLGIFVYRLPRVSHSMLQYYDIDKDYWHKEMLWPISQGREVSDRIKILSYGQSTVSAYQAMELLDYLNNQKNWVHRQYHIGNLYKGVHFSNGKQEEYIIVNDWDTSENVERYQRTRAIMYGKPISPYDEVRWHDAENALNTLGSVVGREPYWALWKVSLGIAGIMGYLHLPYGDLDHVDEIFRQMTAAYEHAFGGNFERDLVDLSPETMHFRASAMIKMAMTKRFIEAGIFPSLG